MKFNSKKFAEDVIAFREKNNLSQKLFQKNSGVSSNAIYRAEEKNLFEINKLIKLCSAIGKKIANYIS